MHGQQLLREIEILPPEQKNQAPYFRDYLTQATTTKTTH
jgi:hypothetical protein